MNRLCSVLATTTLAAFGALLQIGPGVVAAEPVFASGGIRAKVASIAVTPDKRVLTLAAIVENTGESDVVVALVGQPPRAVDNKANAFIAGERQIAGIATCQLHPK